jgi:hypothetical protein
MFPKRILVRDRVRRPPQTGWSWIDRRFVRERADHHSRDALLLYFFLCSVADQNGLSYYGDVALATRLRMSVTALEQARDELLLRDLIAYQRPLTQVLSLPAIDQRRSTPHGPTPPIQTSPGQTPPGHGLFLMRDILLEAAGLPASDSPRQESS